jgi:MoaA/NifB/PqqE/SkfB family radical SAM enzyme
MSIEYMPGDVLTGSSKVRASEKTALSKDEYYIEHAAHNGAVDFYAGLLNGDRAAAADLIRRRFQEYRRGWSQYPKEALADAAALTKFIENPYPPQCIDLEVAAICDLGCPFCFRQFEITPDKTIDATLAFSIIDEAAELQVPSMKFNWRGEPLLHPRIGDFIARAKQRGILETLINTNGTQLTRAMAVKLIEAKLDVLIMSFDGGTKETYEKMRPGRFEKNSFENVVNNLRTFRKVRDEMGARFPFIKVQMIMTEDTRREIDSYYSLFNGYADEVTVTQYTERGGSLADLPVEQCTRLTAHLAREGLPEDTPFMATADGDLYVSHGRLACHQPLQRLMVTYDGRVGMCCFDWGAKHTVGYVAPAFEAATKDFEAVKARVDKGHSAFTMMGNATIKKLEHDPEHEVSSLFEVWRGQAIGDVRRCHVEGKANDVAVCEKCTFKDTYDWRPI